MSDPTPTLGRIVHFVEEDGAEQAAIVIWPGTATEPSELKVFSKSGDYTASALPSSGPVPGCWHWPERV